MSSYVLKILAPGEKVVYSAQLHWIIYAQGMFFTILGGLAGYYAPRIVYGVFGEQGGVWLEKPVEIAALVVVLMGFALILGAYVRQVSTELVVTNQRVIAKYGFISRATFELMISRVTGANFDQTILGRILGYGTIIVRGAGGDISPIDLVADPASFHNAVMGAFEKKPGA
jgi:uncharacterized membrane protein YdbT with pleckstrin-like domain